MQGVSEFICFPSIDRILSAEFYYEEFACTGQIYCRHFCICSIHLHSVVSAVCARTVTNPIKMFGTVAETSAICEHTLITGAHALGASRRPNKLPLPELYVQM